MSIDGVLIRFLILEIKNKLLNKRVKSFFKINNNDFFIMFQNNLNLYITLNSNSHFRIDSNTYLSSNADNFTNTLKKHLESTVLTNIHQFENDRIAIMDFLGKDELGYLKPVKLIFEFFGRYNNLILLNENNQIIDSYKKTSLENLDQRIIQPKLNYEFPTSTSLINPYPTKCLDIYQDYQGFSTILKKEIFFRKNMDFIYSKISPSIIKKDSKLYFHVFELTHLNGEKISFPDISSMLEYYFKTSTEDEIKSNEYKRIQNFSNKEIKKIKEKILKQETELEEAYKNLELEKTGNLIINNLYYLPEYTDKAILLDYYTNEKIEIKLDQSISVKQNAEKYFKKYKKAKRTIPILLNQIKDAKKRITYFEEILSQIDYAKSNDLKEILLELNLVNSSNKKSKKSLKPNITIFVDDFENKYYVGKNNLQNDYLSSKIANKNDYFFHVQNYSGSHVILKGILNENSILLAALLASYYSSISNSENVAVDYTEVKNVKRVPGTKGSFVTYSKHKTVYVTPDYQKIKKLTK
ncbi:MAG: Rqc2 family fibronectin-binding protein [Bacilli bacterium]